MISYQEPAGPSSTEGTSTTGSEVQSHWEAELGAREQRETARHSYEQESLRDPALPDTHRTQPQPQ